MEFTLCTNDFNLDMVVTSYDDPVLPINALLNIHVESSGFCGSTTEEIDIKDFFRFAEALVRMHTSLSGTAELRYSPEEQSLIIFSAQKRGYIHVQGILGNWCNGLLQEFHFENEFDQTYLTPLVHTLQKIL